MDEIRELVKEQPSARTLVEHYTYDDVRRLTEVRYSDRDGASVLLYGGCARLVLGYLNGERASVSCLSRTGEATVFGSSGVHRQVFSSFDWMERIEQLDRGDCPQLRTDMDLSRQVVGEVCLDLDLSEVEGR